MLQDRFSKADPWAWQAAAHPNTQCCATRKGFKQPGVLLYRVHLTSNPRNEEAGESEVSGHSWLHSKFETNLGLQESLSHKTNKQTITTTDNNDRDQGGAHSVKCLLYKPEDPSSNQKPCSVVYVCYFNAGEAETRILAYPALANW